MRNFYVLLSCVVFASGCENYFGDTTRLPNAEVAVRQNLVIGAAFTNTDTILALRTDASYNVFTGYPFRQASAASWPTVDNPDQLIDITVENGESLATFNFIPQDQRRGENFQNNEQYPAYTANNNYVSPADGSIFEPGRTYALSVDTRREAPTVVQQTMPSRIANVELAVDPGIVTDPFGEVGRSVTVSFDDRPEEDNFYILQALVRRRGGTLELVTVTDTDPRTEDFGFGTREIMLTDRDDPATRLSVTFTASLGANPGENELFGVRLLNVTEDWYRYLTDFQRYRSVIADINDGFVDPFPLHSNVPGGFGYFVLGYEEIFPVE